MYDIEEVIKHRKPMRLVDELLSFDENSACVKVNISNASEFYQADKQGVPSYIGIEYMAQCIAAKAGANELLSGGALKLGFLLGTRKYKSTVTYFNCGDTLEVKATRVIEGVDGLSVFECTIKNNKEANILAQAKINVYQPEDPDAYLNDK